MIQKFVDRFMEAKPAIRAEFKAKPPQAYQAVVEVVVRAVGSEDDYPEAPDPKRIHEINDGNYQGTLVYVIGCYGYQPDTYFYVKVGYGSCSGCDTLESIRGYSDEPLTDDQLDEYMTLALHVVQGMKKMGDEAP